MVKQPALLSREELERLDLLKGVDLDSIQGLIDQCPLREIKEGEILIRAGERSELMYLLVSGRLRIHLNYDDVPLRTLEAGEVVGEISSIDGQPASAYAIADTPCRLLELNANNLWSLVLSSPAATVNLLLVLVQRLRQNSALILKTQELQREWERHATVDTLTGLYNRRWLDETLPRVVNRCGKANQPLSVIAIDIDDFKRYNDAYGHLAGDRVLYTVALCLLRNLRPDDLTARYGGDEFIILLPQASSQVTLNVARRLQYLVAETPITLSDGRELASVTISQGVAQMKDGDTPETLLAAADAALYRAKTTGRNRVCE